MTATLLSVPPDGSGVPVWLWQLLPRAVQAYWNARPASLEFLWSSAQSATFGCTILVTAAAQAGAFSTPLSTWLWVQAHWWGLLTAAIIAVWRGNTARSKAAATAAKGS